MEAIIELEDFEILDKWSNSRYKVWEKLLEAKEEDDQDPNADDAPKALIIKYVADEDFKKCPYELRVKIQKPLYIVALFPLINELQRTMNAAFADSELDFKYF